MFFFVCGVVVVPPEAMRLFHLTIKNHRYIGGKNIVTSLKRDWLEDEFHFGKRGYITYVSLRKGIMTHHIFVAKWNPTFDSKKALCLRCFDSTPSVTAWICRCGGITELPR